MMEQLGCFVALRLKLISAHSDLSKKKFFSFYNPFLHQMNVIVNLRAL